VFFRYFAVALCFITTGAAAQTSTPDPATFPPLASVTPPSVDPEVAELGYFLFFDPRLSGDSSTACSECHDPSSGWTDASELSRGYPGTKHWRNSQTIVNAALIGSGLHWDSGLGSLSDQVHDAMGAGFVANIDASLAEERLRQIPEYRTRFQAIWGEDPRKELLAQAIAAYESTLISTDSPFDQALAGDANAMTAAAKRGMAIFTGKGNCVSCHSGALLSDGEFHNTSVPQNPELLDDPLRQVTFRLIMRLNNVDKQVYDFLDRDPGRYLVSKQPQDLGAFRTPPLRYLKYTAPYMHNGLFYTLEEVVDFYNIGGTEDVFGTKSARINPLNLTKNEKGDLVAFLESLSGSEINAATPELPEFVALQIPSRDEVITATRLQSLNIGGGEAQTASISEPEANEGTGLTIVPRQDSPGLKLVPRSQAPVSPSQPTPEDQPQAQTQLQTTNAGGGRFEILNGQRYVTVQRGDSLSSLALLAYGDKFQYQKIYIANRSLISDPNFLTLGAKLRIPQ